MAEYLESGHACKVPHGSLASPLKTWYVFDHDTRVKFTIVFECAAKLKSTSLNDELSPGTDHYSNLIGVLLKFSSRCIAVTAHIKGVFHLVRVTLVEYDGLRFLWRSNDDLHTPPEEYQIVVWCYSFFQCLWLCTAPSSFGPCKEVFTWTIH